MTLGMGSRRIKERMILEEGEINDFRDRTPVARRCMHDVELIPSSCKGVTDPALTAAADLGPFSLSNFLLHYRAG